MLKETALPKPWHLPSDIAETPLAALGAGMLPCRQHGVGGTAAPHSHRWGQLTAKANPQQTEGAGMPSKRRLRGGWQPRGPGIL